MKVLLQFLFVTLFTLLPTPSNAKQCLTSITRIHRHASRSIELMDSSTDKMRDFLMKSIDFEWISKKTLPHTWPMLSKEKRLEFIGLLKQLMYVTYIGPGTTGGSTIIPAPTLEWTKHGGATLQAAISNKSIQTIVEIVMTKVRGGCWVIRNVLIDDVNMVKNYKEQFRIIVIKRGFEELLRRMRKRVAKA